MKRFIPILFLASFSSPAMADIIHQISASTQLRVDSAATQATRIGSTYAVSGNNIQLGTTTTTDSSNNTSTVTSNMGGLTAGTSATSLDAATMVNGTYEIKTAGDAFSLTESFTLGDDAIDFTASTGGVTVEDLHATAATSTTSGGTTTTTPGTFAYGVVTEMPVFGDTTTTAGGHAGGLAGTIKSSGEITLTAGGAGTTATGQITSTLTIR
jgi:hypothetical protein|tara:strand:- start:240 stop:875 length:636 start_codon:yes stop_codon:yes gene_type:complete